MHVEGPPVVNIPVLTIQDHLAVARARVPVSMDIRGRLPAMSPGMDVLPPRRELLSGGEDLLGLICPELGVAPLVDPGTDLEDERLTPIGSPSSAVDEYVPLSMTPGVDLEVARALLDVGVLPSMVMPIVDPAVGCSMTPAMYPVSPVPMLSLVDLVLLKITLPAGPAGGPARSEALLGRVSSPASVSSPGHYPSSPVLHSAPDVSPPSGLAAMDQDLLWSAALPLGVSADSPLLPTPLTPRLMVAGVVVPGSVVSSLPGDTDVAGGRPGCQTCLWRAPLTFIRTGPRLVPLHGCWMVCGVASTA